jgi:hypothetical protein
LRDLSYFIKMTKALPAAILFILLTLLLATPGPSMAADPSLFRDSGEYRQLLSFAAESQQQRNAEISATQRSAEYQELVTIFADLQQAFAAKKDLRAERIWGRLAERQAGADYRRRVRIKLLNARSEKYNERRSRIIRQWQIAKVNNWKDIYLRLQLLTDAQGRALEDSSELFWASAEDINHRPPGLSVSSNSKRTAQPPATFGIGPLFINNNPAYQQLWQLTFEQLRNSRLPLSAAEREEINDRLDNLAISTWTKAAQTSGQYLSPFRKRQEARLAELKKEYRNALRRGRQKIAASELPDSITEKRLRRLENRLYFNYRFRVFIIEQRYGFPFIQFLLRRQDLGYERTLQLSDRGRVYLDSRPASGG